MAKLKRKAVGKEMHEDVLSSDTKAKVLVICGQIAGLASRISSKEVHAVYESLKGEKEFRYRHTLKHVLRLVESLEWETRIDASLGKTADEPKAEEP
jgi:hypothetical protein